ncbi:LysR substrate-binding domain-containing protein [Janthinobacterium sp. RB2R34]|uniref:LysR substrate-binding domain-containing protein n=1 Tax=Janthinobacterium sp. RB2R34 TaxID=3424193 RepID=UPI003F203386
MRALDTHALNLFCAVARCLNFRQAAQQLHMTQPPLSRAIKALEDKLGTRLFERDTQGVALTGAGAALLPQALRILALLDQAERSLVRGSAAPQLRLGLTTSVEAGLFRPWLAQLEAQLPATTVRLQAGPSPSLITAVRKGKLDAALVALPANTFELAVETLLRQPMMVALPAGHALARKRRLRLADLQAFPVFWFERARQPAFFDHCQQVFSRHGYAPAFLREPADHHVLLAEVATGKGAALLADSFRALRLAGVAYRALAEGDELALQIALVWPGEKTHPALACLRGQANA